MELRGARPIRRRKFAWPQLLQESNVPPTNLRMLERIALCKRGEPLRALFLFL